MIRFGIRNILPPEGGAAEDQARACLAPLRSDSHRVAALTFFVDAAETESYRTIRDSILALVRETFGDAVPPTSVVAQAPEGGLHVALEAAIVDGSQTLERRSHEGHPYSVVLGDHGRAIFGGGVARNHTIGQAW